MINSINSRQINDTFINGPTSSFAGPLASGEGLLISVEQSIVLSGSGQLIYVEQETELRYSGVGLLIDIEQNTVSIQSGKIIGIEQLIISTSADQKFNTFGWDASIFIGGWEVPSSQIHGNIEVTRTRGTASLANFTIIPTSGQQDADLFIGKAVVIDIRTSRGIRRAFTGTVDYPDIDLINKKITFNCTDRRKERINEIIGPSLPVIGSYSSILFPNTPKDNFEELENRLSTVQLDVDFDAYGNLYIVPWTSKSVADFTFDDNVVYRSTPTVEYTQRDRLLNKAEIKFQYRRERLYHWQRTFSWRHPAETNAAAIVCDGYNSTRRDLIAESIRRTGWVLTDPITYMPSLQSGWYRCGGPGIGGGWVGYSSIQTSGTTQIVTDSEGNIVTDSSGNPVYSVTNVVQTNWANAFTLGVDFKLSYRWVQTVTETFNLVVNAPQSQSQYGVVESSFSYSHEDSADNKEWEEYDRFLGTIKTTYFIESAADRNLVNSAISTALNIAKNQILDSHRDTRVSVSRDIFPEIDLRHTLSLDTDVVLAKGRVSDIKHTLNTSTGEAKTDITLLLSKSRGSASDSSLIAPVFANDSISLPNNTISLGNHFGQDPSITNGSENWTGFIGNTFRTSFANQFIVDTPEVPSSARDERLRSISTSYDVSIPNDLLTINF